MQKYAANEKTVSDLLLKAKSSKATEVEKKTETALTALQVDIKARLDTAKKE